MMYYRTPDGNPVSNLRSLIPQVISPHHLTDAELATHGVARCDVVQPDVGWWQRRGDRQINAAETPHVITWGVEDRPLEDVKAIAWQIIKGKRDERQRGLMPYTSPSGDTHHNEMTDKVIRDLSASTTAALVLASQGVTAAVMPWTVYENVTHMLAPAEMIAFGLAATQWHSAIHMTSQAIRPQIEAAESVEELVAIVDSLRWPGE